ncbi:MAG: hypothetical protein N3A54_06160, partial [Patescibacteria group bacterium]|nr:hypothetical protein [Patescibacteria group bacterium]
MSVERDKGASSSENNENKSQTLAEKLIDLARKITKELAEKVKKSLPKDRQPLQNDQQKSRLSEDIRHIVEKKPNPQEIYEIYNETQKNTQGSEEYRLENLIPLTQETKLLFEKKLQEKKRANPQSKIVQILESNTPTDERTAYLAIQLLDVDEEKISSDNEEQEKLIRITEDYARIALTTSNTEVKQESYKIVKELRENCDEIEELEDINQLISSYDEILRPQSSFYGLRREAQPQVPSTLQVTEEERVELENDPIGFIERLTQEIEKATKTEGYDSPTASYAEQRLQLGRVYLLSDEYTDQRLDLLIEEGKISIKDKQERLRYAQAMKEQIGKLLRSQTARIHGSRFVELYSRTPKIGGQQG